MCRFFMFFGILLASVGIRAETMSELKDRVFRLAEIQYVAIDSILCDGEFPTSATGEGELVASGINWWCSGFYPGCLWYIYEYGGSQSVRKLAVKHTERLDPLKYVTTDHDIGFQLNCSFGNGYRLTGNPDYLKVLEKGARSLATRFNATTGVLKSWDFVMDGRDWKYPVIIDNMMNLELLMVAAASSGNEGLRKVACSHAETTMRNHFRPDFTSFHLVDYDPESGLVRSKETVQGYSDDSSWGRGQAWALYGYTMMYRLSGDNRFLSHAEGVADMLLSRLPADGVPQWDFNAPADIGYRDSSAAAIMASAFIELGKLTSEKERGEKCLDMAERQLRTLASPEYLAEEGRNGHFLLKHGVGNYPACSEIDVPLVYADYYFLEALLRY